MIDSDDDCDDYPLFNDAMYKSGFLEAGQVAMPFSAGSDNSWGGIVSESFDSSAFLCSSTSDDIANYNFLEPLMPMLDDTVNGAEQDPITSAAHVETCSVDSVSSRMSYQFDPVSLSIVRCVVTSNNPLSCSSSEPAISAVSNTLAPENESNHITADDDDELDTSDITRRVSEELRRCNISQALFAQAVLGRSQGTLSDLLRKPKPWAQLKSGRETFVKMQQWLMEPEKQRLASLNAIDTSGQQKDDN